MKKTICAVSAIILSAAAFVTACGNDEGVLVDHNENAYHIVETEPASTMLKRRPVVTDTTSAPDETESTDTTKPVTAAGTTESDTAESNTTEAVTTAVDDTSESDEPIADNSGESAEDKEASTEAEREEYYLEGIIYRKSIGGIFIKEKDMSLISISFDDTSLLDELNVGDEVRVTYDGYIMESYPAQAHHAYDAEVINEAVYEGEVKHFRCDNPAVNDSFSVILPDDWTVKEIEYPTDGDFTDWGFRIIPNGETTGLDITWHSSFSVREAYDVFPITVNGYEVQKYGANGDWHFYGYDNGYVAANNFYGTDKYGEYADEFEFILNTLVFGLSEFIGE